MKHIIKKRINKSALFPLLALVILVAALSQQLFGIPPLGKLLDPFIGAVQNDADRNLDAVEPVTISVGTADSVYVFFDERKVPHINAKNSHDMYFAQGYVTASLRLWQMDFLTYISAGRLSEIFEEDGVLNYDREQRRIGMLEAAKASLALIEKDASSDTVLTAYTDGVNAYIKQLNYKNMPLEYKLMDYKPEAWSNLKTVLIMKYMANTLSGYEEDFSMSSMMLALGEEKFNKYFPDFHGRTAPFVNTADSQSLNLAAGYIKKPDYLNYSFFASGSVLAKSTYNPKLGSNSWVVSGAKTRSGYPILCSDPHLNLSLPSIWLEMQLSSPGINVYGVAIPGTPAIIIGFNEHIAWGITNGADDVKDWYKLKLAHDYKQYEFNGKWMPLDFTVEEIKRKNRKAFYDTIYHTLHGPVTYSKDFDNGHHELLNHALQWELHKPSNEFLTFINLNKAKNFEDYRQAIKYYHCPVQNFTFASKENDIAVTHQGRLPVKNKGQGKFILDGTTNEHLYTSYIPEDSLPYVLNPASNYVISANQHPTDAAYPYYYNGYFSENRARRIKQLLESGNSFDIEKMKAIQLDNTSIFATEALPVLLGMMDRTNLPEEDKRVLESLSTWNGAYDISNTQARFFELWWKNTKDYTWDEFKALAFYSRMPDDDILLNLIQREPANAYFDKQGTSRKELASDIVAAACLASLSQYRILQQTATNKWGDSNRVSLTHLANIGAFSKMNIPSSGFPEAINAVSAGWGPSWRMIVELGDKPRAFGIYAGGQSGNIGSGYYDSFVNDWASGTYYPLQFFMSISEARQHCSGRWILK